MADDQTTTESSAPEQGEAAQAPTKKASTRSASKAKTTTARKSGTKKAASPLFSASQTDQAEAPAEPEAPRLAAASLLFQAPDLSAAPPRRSRS
ncbi:MAG TPA: hypothetical protein GX743_00955, partial [Actinomycetales bacterium]|nr:hypothetical protein [Actinomycetales bacterium]